VRLGAPDLWIGLAVMALAGIYYAAALGISDSLLSDEVGAAGLPKLLAVALALAGALIALRSQTMGGLRVTVAVTARALGLVAMLAAYIVLLPLAGYPLTLAALIAGMALLGGARPNLSLAAISIAAGAGFWLVFAGLFHIRMPAGLIMRGF
jgi:putative tricarboxylic transport membrane protein